MVPYGNWTNAKRVMPASEGDSPRKPIRIHRPKDSMVSTLP